MMKKILVLLVLAILTMPVIRAQNVGDLAPEFSLNLLNGGTFTLSENSGKVVMIFVLGYNCGLCISGAPAIQTNLVDEFAGNPDYIPIGIDVWDGSAAQVESFITKTGITIPLLMNGGAFASAYGLTRDRLVLIDADGKIIFKGAGGVSNDVNKVKDLVNVELELTPNAINTKEASAFDLRIAPNPVSDYTSLSFNLPAAGNIVVEIRALDGRLIQEAFSGYTSEGQQDLSLNLSGISKGIYLTTLTINNNQQEVVRLVKN